MSTRTVLASLSWPVLNAARQSSIRLDDLGLPPSLYDATASPHERIPTDLLCAVWRAAAERSRDPLFGVHVGAHFTSASHLGAVGFLMRHSPTVRDAFGHASRYANLVENHKAIHLEPSGQDVALVGDTNPRPPLWSHHSAESRMAAAVSLLRSWAGPRFALRRIEFHHPRSDGALLEAFFGCKVLFSRSADRMIVSADTLAAPLPAHDVELYAFFRAQADSLLSAQPTVENVREQLRQALVESLPQGTPSLEQAARALSLSSRTLQRRLGEMGRSFRDALDEARREAALEALTARARPPLHQTAEAAGFRDEKAFRRAFRRWTGDTPGAYRARDASNQADAESPVGVAPPVGRPRSVSGRKQGSGSGGDSGSSLLRRARRWLKHRRGSGPPHRARARTRRRT
jgi:AraC-like DNA-binding protein